MKILKIFLFLIIIITSITIGITIQKYGVINMIKTTYIKTNEPLLLSAEGKSEYFHMLPPGTPLYKYRDDPEGLTTYMVYINIKSEFSFNTIESDKINLIDPIWAKTISPEQLPMVLSSVPISKDELVQILKARKISRDELAQIVRDWKD